MQNSRIKHLIFKAVGLFLTIIGTALLEIKIIRQYLPMVEAYSLELFLIGPALMVLGLVILVKDSKIKKLKTGSHIALGITITYMVVLTSSWVCIYIA